jgi:hypothetical protein
MMAATSRIELDMKELEKYLEQARAVLGEDGYTKLKAALETLDYLTGLIEGKDMTIDRLRRIIFGAITEKTRTVLEGQTQAATMDRKFKLPKVRRRPRARSPASGLLNFR